MNKETDNLGTLVQHLGGAPVIIYHIKRDDNPHVMSFRKYWWKSNAKKDKTNDWLVTCHDPFRHNNNFMSINELSTLGVKIMYSMLMPGDLIYIPTGMYKQMFSNGLSLLFILNVYIECLYSMFILNVYISGIALLSMVNWVPDDIESFKWCIDGFRISTISSMYCSRCQTASEVDLLSVITQRSIHEFKINDYTKYLSHFDQLYVYGLDNFYDKAGQLNRDLINSSNLQICYKARFNVSDIVLFQSIYNEQLYVGTIRNMQFDFSSGRIQWEYRIIIQTMLYKKLLPDPPIPEVSFWIREENVLYRWTDTAHEAYLPLLNNQ